MKKKQTSFHRSASTPLLADLKARVLAAQMKAAVSVNRELILLYWHIGREILRSQKAEGWGTKVVERLVRDLTAEFSEMGGFSVRNLKYMLAIVEAWEPTEIVQQLGGLLGDSIGPQDVCHSAKAKAQQPVAPIVSQPVRQLGDAPPEPLTGLSWSANLILLHKLKDPATRLWYAREVLKDPYMFDFLTQGEDAYERHLERGLVEHVQKLLLEMGAGFAFVVRQVPLELGDEGFFLDLLFYQLCLRCFVVVDLKMKPFETEPSGARQTAAGGPKSERGGAHQFAGKMNFSLSAVDDLMRHEHGAPTFGLLLCKNAKNQLKIEPKGVRQICRRRTRRARRGAASIRAARCEIAHWRDRVADAVGGVTARESARRTTEHRGHRARAE